MKRLVISTIAIASMTFLATPALAHDGGHAGGCADFGRINRQIAQSPGAYGFPWARNLGDIVSSFAQAADLQPGVADIVEDVDHAACE
jgi:hypothetical protein